MSFDNVVGGKLKLKGGVELKKDKKKRKRKDAEDGEEKDTKKQKTEEGAVGTSPPPQHKPKKTAAELAYEERQRERLREKASKMAHKSHRQKIEEYNDKLSKETEHYDIPKVGPG